MDDRIKTRLQDQTRSGMGAAFPENQRLTLGLSTEEAEEAARAARGEVAEKSTGPSEEKEEVAEVPPPDLAEATQDEVDTAKQLIGLVREAQQEEDVTDPHADPLLATDLRKSIEANLDPIDLQLLLFHGKAEQAVPLLNGALNVVIRTLGGDEISLIKRWVDNSIRVQLSPAQKFKVKHQVQCAMQIASMNGDIPGNCQLPNSRSILQPKFKEVAKVFEKKLNWFLSLNPDIIDLLVLNVAWFQQRVRRVVADNAYVGQEIKKS